jgi:hypothetical protein
MLDKLRDLVSANPQLVNSRGGDGQMPLHFANTVEVAEYLLQQGAEIDARDIDHESTPAQYMVRDRQPVLRASFDTVVRRTCSWLRRSATSTLSGNISTKTQTASVCGKR